MSRRLAGRCRFGVLRLSRASLRRGLLGGALLWLGLLAGGRLQGAAEIAAHIADLPAELLAAALADERAGRGDDTAVERS